jgi:hypothetical protein
MKKLLYSAAIFGAVMVAFASCKKDDDKNNDPATVTVRANVEEGAELEDLIKRVQAGVDGGEEFQTIADADFVDGGFSLTLSEAPDEENFVALKYFLSYEGADVDELTISNSDASIAQVFFFGFSSEDGDYENEDYEGEFYADKAEETEGAFSNAYPFYVYVDADVTVTGTYNVEDDEEEIWNVSLKKGWNAVYYTFEGNLVEEEWMYKNTYSTTPVSGIKWYFDGNSSSSVGRKAESISERTKAIKASRKK